MQKDMDGDGDIDILASETGDKIAWLKIMERQIQHLQLLISLLPMIAQD